MRVTAYLLMLLAVVAVSACSQGESESPESQLRNHFENVIVPETEAALVPLAESCDIDGETDPTACQMFAVHIGELATIRMARYWEAMHWLGVTEPGDEIIPEVYSVQDDCEDLAFRIVGDLDADYAAGMCSFFRSEQLPPCGSSGTGDLNENLAGFEYCLSLFEVE